MNAHDTPSGTKMMWKASVNAICARAHGTGFTCKMAVSAPSVAVMTSRAWLTCRSQASPARGDVWLASAVGRFLQPCPARAAEASEGRPRPMADTTVLVVGGGFAGLTCAQQLAKH